MAIDFPNAPSVNDYFTVGDRTWQWDGTSWSLTANTNGAVSATSLSVTGEFTLPTTAGTASQVMVTDGSGGVTWSDVTASPAGSDGQVQYNNGGLTGGASSLYYDDVNGRVGIGTTSPEEELHVEADQNGDLTQVLIENANQRIRLGAYHESGVAQYAKIQSEDDGGGNTVLALNPEGGKVGIGTMSPANPLHIKEDSYGLLSLDRTANANVDQQVVLAPTWNGANNTALDFVIGSQIMRLTEDGKVGIGTTSPAGELEVSSTSPLVVITDTDGVASGTIEAKIQFFHASGLAGQIGFGTASGNMISFSSGGHYYSGSQHSTGNHYLRAYGADRFWVDDGGLNPYVDNTYDLGNGSRRFDDVYATNGTIQVSDERDKADVEVLDRGLEFVNALNPVSFRWSDRGGKEGSRTHWGLLAQDVAGVLGDEASDMAVWIHNPSVDEIDEEGNTVSTLDRQGLRYNELMAPMVKAIQELSAQNAELVARIETLEAN